MKLYRILAGLLAITSLLNGLVCLFTQPMASAMTNDRIFAGSFIIGCAFIALFMWADRQINGTTKYA